MKNKGILIAMILVGMVFCGCGAVSEKEETIQMQQEEKQQRESEKDAAVIKDNTNEETENSPSAAVGLWKGNEYATTILEDDEAVYFCGSDHIKRISKADNSSPNIWEASAGMTENNAFVYADSRGILVNDKIYFIEKWETQEKQESVTLNHALAVVKTDGTGYERIKKVSEDSVNKLILLDGVLYFEGVRNSHSLSGYAVDREGSLLTEKTITAEVKNIPEEYTAPFYDQNGSRMLTPVESNKRYGFYLMNDENYDLCRIDPGTGEVEELPLNLMECSLRALNDEYWLFDSYSDDKMYLYDIDSGETRDLGTYDGYAYVIAMDETYLYIQYEVVGDDFSQYHYKQILLDTGAVTDLFVLDGFAGMTVASPWYMLDISLLNGYLYYPGLTDYKFINMRRHVEMPNAEEWLGDAYFDSYIGQVGSIKSYQEKIYSEKNPEWVTYNLDLEWLVVDEKFPGAANINRILEEEQQANIKYGYENAKWQDEWYTEEDDSITSTYSLSSSVSQIYYMDNNYMSFVQTNYDYTGGAHGMPYWIGYVFDLQTGEQLGLMDITADDELKVKGLVTQYFTKMYAEDPGMYWDSAVDTVFEYTTLESQFYLSEEGIVFYFGPYDLASYAAGFQEIVVPYSEFNLKIPLNG